MTREAAGVLALNGLFLVVGLAILFAIRGWRTWLDFFGHLGVAYVMGLGSVGVLATLVLVVGGGLGLVTILALCCVPVLACVELGIWRKRPLPPRRGPLPRIPPSGLPALGAVVVTGMLLVEFWRLGRVEPMTGWDAWAFWLPKAKTIYFFGGIDNTLFTSFAGGSYPLLVPALDAMGFRFMGGTTETTALSFQYWLFFVGFLGAAAALLRPLARAWLVWLFVGLATMIPEIDDRLYMGLADWPLDMFWVLAALFVVRWLWAGEWWLLVGYGVTLAAAIATKREGQLLAACLVGGVLLATVRRWRWTWLPVIGVAALAYAVNVPWRIWWTSRHLESDTPAVGLGGIVSNGERIWPSLHLVLTLQFDSRFWLWLLPLALAAAALCLTVTGIARESAALYLLTTLFSLLGFTWILVSQPGLQLTTHGSDTPIPRAVGAVVLLATMFSPLLIEPLLRGGPSRSTSRRPELEASGVRAAPWP